jgi:hypothetical protein
MKLIDRHDAEDKLIGLILQFKNLREAQAATGFQFEVQGLL